MNLILHPGHGKAGSTAIQNFIISHLNQLQASGVAIPDKHLKFPKPLDRIPADNFNLLEYFDRLLENQKYTEFENDLKAFAGIATANGFHTLVISSERLSPDNEKINENYEQIYNIFNKLFDIIKSFTISEDRMIIYFPDGNNGVTSLEKI